MTCHIPRLHLEMLWMNSNQYQPFTRSSSSLSPSSNSPLTPLATELPPNFEYHYLELAPLLTSHCMKFASPYSSSAISSRVTPNFYLHCHSTRNKSLQHDQYREHSEITQKNSEREKESHSDKHRWQTITQEHSESTQKTQRTHTRRSNRKKLGDQTEKTQRTHSERALPSIAECKLSFNSIFINGNRS